MKNIKKLVACILTMFLLTGCMEMNMTIDVTNDASVTTSMRILAATQLLSATKVSEEDFLSGLKTQLTDSGDQVQIEEIEESKSGMKYVGVKATNAATSAVSATVKEGKLTVEIPFDDIKKILESNNLNADTLKKYGYTVDQLKGLGVSMTVVVNMPAKAQTNFGEAKGKTVTIDLLDLIAEDDTVVNTIIVTSDTSADSGKVISYVIYGVMAIAIAVLVYLLVKSRKVKA